MMRNESKEKRSEVVGEGERGKGRVRGCYLDSRRFAYAQGGRVGWDVMLDGGQETTLK